MLGYKKNFVIYDDSEQLGAIKKILSGISAKGESTEPRAILSLIGRFKNGGSQAAAFAEPSVRALAEHVLKRYESALRACNWPLTSLRSASSAPVAVIAGVW